MKISIIIKKHDVVDDTTKKVTRSWYGATAKGRYLMQLVTEDATTGKIDDFDGTDTKGLTINDQDTSFVVKITQKSGVQFPTAEGVYSLEFNGQGWVDTRADCKRPTFRIDGKDFKFTKTHDLKQFDEPAK